jgi:hypothetical protein
MLSTYPKVSLRTNFALAFQSIACLEGSHAIGEYALPFGIIETRKCQFSIS